MLNHLGLTVSWDKAMKFFASRRIKQEKDIATLTPADIPVILMVDNINIYRAKQSKDKQKQNKVFATFKVAWPKNVEFHSPSSTHSQHG
jgi:hypothetical protein